MQGAPTGAGGRGTETGTGNHTDRHGTNLETSLLTVPDETGEVTPDSKTLT